MTPLGVGSKNIPDWVFASVLTGAMYIEDGCMVDIDGNTSFANNSARDHGGKNGR